MINDERGDMGVIPANRALRTYLAEARAVQWQKSKVRTKSVDDGEGGKAAGAPPSDPTADAALDPVRLRLRDAVRRGERALKHGGPEEQAASARVLAEALDAWAGH